MKARKFVILLAALALLPANVFAQKLDKLNGLQLEYWRSFHELIQQRVIVTSDGEIALNTTITPLQHPGEPPPKPRHTVKTISERDLAPVLAFFNDADARTFFASSKPDNRPDGSSLSLTVTQNSFSLSFRSQDAFPSATRNLARYHAAFGRVALELIKLAGVTIRKDELY